jgi:hypothetical protein
MRVLTAIAGGFRRCVAAPGMILGLWLVNLLVALPAAVLVAGSLRRSIGASLVHEKLRAGFDVSWFDEFRAAARGIETAFTTSRVMPSAFLDNLEGLVTGRVFGQFPVLVLLGVLFAVVWALLLGAVLQRLAAPAERLGVAGFLRAGGRFFWRVIRLALLSGVLYAAVFALQLGLFEWLREITRDVTSETTVLGYSLAVYALTAVLLTLIHMVFGYAKVATVVEDRRSMILAAFRGALFVVRHPVGACGQYYGVLLLSAALLGCYVWLAPGPGQATTTAVVLAFFYSQAFLILKLFMRLSLLGGQIELFLTSQGQRIG